MINTQKKLGTGSLIAIVFSSVVGGGIFNISQNMAAGAGAGATIISWILSGIGVFFLVNTFKILALTKPELNAGIYEYAKQGFGNYAGFNIAWGYWLCAAMGNVVFAIMLNDSFGEFFPVLLKHGWPTLVFGSVFIWMMYGIVLGGVKTAAAINTIVSVIKFITLFFIIGMFCISFKAGIFAYDFWGSTPDLGSVTAQVKSTMLVTIWSFMGIEGAVVMSANADNPKAVGKAGIAGFFLSLLLYALISILSYGVMHQSVLKGLDDPSVAYILKSALGKWAYTFVIISVIIAVLGGWLSWTLLCAQVPYTASEVKILPKIFLRKNKNGTPIFALFFTSIFMEIFLILTSTSKSIYMAAVDMTSVLIMPAYLFCGLYLWKASLNKNETPGLTSKQRICNRCIAIITSLFCLWVIYAGGLKLFMVSSVFYFPGIYFFIKARKENRLPDEPIFTKAEWILGGIITFASVFSIFLVMIGDASF